MHSTNLVKSMSYILFMLDHIPILMNLTYMKYYSLFLVILNTCCY